MRFDKLAVEFFHKFSRAEFVLKAHNFYDAKAEPDWMRFASEAEHIISNTKDSNLLKAIEYLENYPPMKQIVDRENNRLEFKVCAPGQNTKSKNLSVYLRRIRNNLFHGGKVNGNWFAPDRRELLLMHGITIIEAYMKFSPSFSEAFEMEY